MILGEEGEAEGAEAEARSRERNRGDHTCLWHCYALFLVLGKPTSYIRVPRSFLQQGLLENPSSEGVE